MNLLSLTQAVIDGLMAAGVYAIVGVGLSLSFGVMRIINWAHGDLLMVSMYVAYFLVAFVGVDPYLSILIVAPVMYGIGYILQKYIFNRLIMREKSREPMTVLLFTSGLATLLSNAAMIAFGFVPKMAKTAYTGKTIKFGEFIVAIPRLAAFIIALALALGFYAYVQKSERGRMLRATSQNREVAQLMGIDHRKIYCFAMAISLAMSGVAASLLIPYFPVSPSTGLTFGMKSFVIVVLGGKGNILGCLLGGLIIGLIEKVGGLYITDTYTMCIVMLLFVVVLLIKPSGLLSKERE